MSTISQIFSHYWQLLGVFIFAMLSPLVFIKLVLPYIRKVIQKKNKLLFKRFIEVKLFFSFGFILPPLLIYIVLSNLAISEKELLYKELIYIRKAAGFLIIVFTPILFNKIISAINLTYKKKEFFVKYPVNSYLQLLKLLIFIISIILAICYLLNLSPWGILSGIGALGAILLLVFKDTILGLVASIQVYGGGLVKEGDWIELKALDIDGEVMEVGLHRVKVKAWDNSVTTFPTSKFLELTFKNWRNMTESGGRRIKRTIILKTSSIKFVDKKLFNNLLQIPLLKKYLEEKSEEIKKDNANNKEIDLSVARKMTNIGCFRAYIYKYLENHKSINNSMTLLVRQLPTNEYGLPIEIYTFTNTTKWKDYENIQSDIFDHLLASVSSFELVVFQFPSSLDVNKIKLP
ncbi:MAG: hypothetical protein CBE11_01885 [Rickettsiales bacterium TMED251]|nr:MAG: hypothetical protein CBE11_01885 [Rickettsiales bacterium TMED251]